MKCYAPGNPEPDVKCELWDENNVVLRSEGKYYYLLQVSFLEIQLTNAINFSSSLFELNLLNTTQDFRQSMLSLKSCERRFG